MTSTSTEPTLPDLSATRLYLAGPMRGYPLHNFPAFGEARAWLRSRGADVFCPAEYDLQHGFDPARSCEEQGFDVEAALRHDLEVIADDRTGVVFMPGSAVSAGALAEFEMAKVLDLDLFLYAPLAPVGGSRLYGPLSYAACDAYLEEVRAGRADATAASFLGTVHPEPTPARRTA